MKLDTITRYILHGHLFYNSQCNNCERNSGFKILPKIEQQELQYKKHIPRKLVKSLVCVYFSY